MGMESILAPPAIAAAMARADVGEVVVEKEQPGQPRQGKVFAAVHAHLDDVPYYAACLCAKLIHEGYTGYSSAPATTKSAATALPSKTSSATNRSTSK